MENIRLFISISLETGLSRDIYKRFQSLDLPWEKLRPVDPQILHLTLKFLGNTPVEKIPDLINALSSLEKTEAIDIEIKGASVLDPRRPRILRLDFADNPKLQQLYDDIEQVLFDDGLAHKEVRKFTPHITLARIKQQAEVGEFKEFSDWKINRNFSVGTFELQESILTKKGPEYTVLQSFDI